MSADYIVGEHTVAPGACNVIYPNKYGWSFPPGPANIPTFIPWIPPYQGPSVTGTVTLHLESHSGLLALVRALLTAVENKTISEETMKRVLDLLDKGA